MVMDGNICVNLFMHVVLGLPHKSHGVCSAHLCQWHLVLHLWLGMSSSSDVFLVASNLLYSSMGQNSIYQKQNVLFSSQTLLPLSNSPEERKRSPISLLNWHKIFYFFTSFLSHTLSPLFPILSHVTCPLQHYKNMSLPLWLFSESSHSCPCHHSLFFAVAFYWLTSCC